LVAAQAFAGARVVLDPDGRQRMGEIGLAVKEQTRVAGDGTAWHFFMVEIIQGR
jgi:hypothetical protein